MRWTRALAVVGLSLCAAPAAHAQQGWTFLPDGTTQYGFTYQTSMSVGCWHSNYMLEGSSCTSNGKTVTLGNGGSFLDVTVTPAAPRAGTSNNVGRTLLPIGTVSWQFYGVTPFAWPRARTYEIPFFALGIGFSVLGPVPFSGSFAQGYGIRDPGSALRYRCCDNFYNAFVAPTEPPPAGHYQYGLAFYDPSSVVIDPANSAEGSVELMAATSLMPEPGTLALLAPALLALGALARRRLRG